MLVFTFTLRILCLPSQCVQVLLDWSKDDLHTLRWKATDRAEWQRVVTVRRAIDINRWPRPWSHRKRRRYYVYDVNYCFCI